METTELIFFLITVAYLIGLTYFLVRVRNHYHNLIKISGKVNLTEILEAILDKLKENRQDLDNIKKQIDILKNDSRLHIQKVGILRYNPFSNTGGDQSFVVAVLDDSDSGIVLTSLHNRESTRWYAKNVKEGKGTDFQLTEEEKKAIKLATVNKKVK